MDGHIHTGPVALIFAGVSAILVIQGMRIAAMQLAKMDATAGAAKVIAALVTFESPIK